MIRRRRLFMLLLILLSISCRFCASGIEPLTDMLIWLTGRFSRTFCFMFIAVHTTIFDALTCGTDVHTCGVIVVYGIITCVLFSVRARLHTPPALISTVCATTIAFDALTGLTIGPLLFDQPFMHALIGQIPFTCARIIGNCLIAFGYVVSTHIIALIKAKCASINPTAQQEEIVL